MVISGIGLVLIGNAFAADTDKAKSSPASREQMQDTKENGVPDETQKQYITRLKRINEDLRKKHSAFAKNYIITKGNREKMDSNLQWGYGRVPSQVLRNLQDLANEKAALESAIRELDKEKADLRADVLSFYDGKVPQWLSRQWDKEEKSYRDDVDTNYLQVQWSLERPDWEGDEKVFRDYMQEYYRLRQK